MDRKKIIVITVIIISLLAYVLFVVFSIANNKEQEIDISQATAPPYDGQPVVSFDDQTNGQLYHALGGDDYISIKYFIGEYVHSKGIPIDPIPTVKVFNYSNDIQFLGKTGAYKGIYTFDVYSSNIDKSFTIVIEEYTENASRVIAIPAEGLSKNLDSYQFERDFY
jgi:Ca2+/Na+ antiporter